MDSVFHVLAPENQCSYLPEQLNQLEYEICITLTAEEFQQRLLQGWRRFGHTLFRPRCRACRACQSLRVPVATFRPNRSQRRAWNRNVADLRRVVGRPAVSREKLDLYDRFHEFQSDFKDWPTHGPKDPGSYTESFVANPYRTEEWQYFLDDRLVAVGYVDPLPEGLSAIYFYYDPEDRERSLGTFNILSMLAEARERELPYVYLGYFVEGCRSLEYKGQYTPNEVLTPEGTWVPFRT